MRVLVDQWQKPSVYSLTALGLVLAALVVAHVLKVPEAGKTLLAVAGAVALWITVGPRKAPPDGGDS